LACRDILKFSKHPKYIYLNERLKGNFRSITFNWQPFFIESLNTHTCVYAEPPLLEKEPRVHVFSNLVLQLIKTFWI